MQNDIKLAPELRRKYVCIIVCSQQFAKLFFSYKHALDGVYRVCADEGVTKLFNGATMATSRAVLMTIGQLAFYDQIKQWLIASDYFADNLTTHFTSSFLAVSVTHCLKCMFLHIGEYCNDDDTADGCAEDAYDECKTWRIQGQCVFLVSSGTCHF